MMKPKLSQGASITTLNQNNMAADSSRSSGCAGKSYFLIAIILALWGGGISCLLCCASDLQDGRCQAGHAVSRHSCCAQTDGNKSAVFEKLPSGAQAATNCCLLSEQTSGPVALPQSKHDRGVVPETFEAVAAHDAYFRLPLASASAPPRDRGGTYLRCCALLI